MLPVGSKVKLSGGSKWARMGPWTIQKINPTKYKLVNGEGVILNAPHGMCTPIEGEETTTRPRPEGIRVGAVGTLARPVAEFDAETLFVVFKDSFDTINVVPLGGDEKRRYWTISPYGFNVIKLGSTQ